MSIFTGPMYPGAMREHRRILREEAEARNARTPEDRTAAWRRKHPVWHCDMQCSECVDCGPDKCVCTRSVPGTHPYDK